MVRKKSYTNVLTHNEGKSAVAKRFIRTFTIYKLDDIVNKYNNSYHRTIKIKPADVKSSTYINSSKEIIDKGPKFKSGDIVRISK